MNLLITGGAGFLGYHTANRLAKDNHKITLLDISDFIESEYPPGTKYQKGDVRDLQLLDKLMQGIDIVVHAAAALPLWKNKEIYSVNIDGTRAILDCALKHKVRRVIFISSTAVYGIPKKHPIEEDDPLVGVGAYGESKIIAEKICEEYRKKGICIPIIRPKTFIGTGRLGVFQILYDWVHNGKRIPIIGSGNNRYQLLEVQDLVNAIALCVTKRADETNDTFNVGAERFGKVKEDVGALCDFAGSGAKVLVTPAWLVKFALRLFELLKLSPLYKWVYGTADKDSFVSIEKIKKKLGWKPRYSNAEALINSYKWYLEHQEEIKNAVGVTHRVAWKQGILGFFKKFM